MRLCLASVLLLCAAFGCAPRARRDAGAAIAGTGALTSLIGIGVAVGCAPFEDEDDDPSTSSCEDDGLEPNPEVGLPVIGVGIAIAIIGGVIYGMGEPAPPAASEPEQEPPPSDYLF